MYDMARFDGTLGCDPKSLVGWAVAPAGIMMGRWDSECWGKWGATPHNLELTAPSFRKVAPPLFLEGSMRHSKWNPHLRRRGRM